MACWCSSFIFSIPFLVSHFTTATDFGFFRSYGHLYRTIQINEDMGIFCFAKGGGQTSSLLIQSGTSVMWWKVLEILFIFSMPRYFLKSALLNRGCFCSAKSVSIAPAGTLWNNSRPIFFVSLCSKNFFIRSQKRSFFNHFHNPHFQGLVYWQDLSFSLYAQQSKY